MALKLSLFFPESKSMFQVPLELWHHLTPTLRADLAMNKFSSICSVFWQHTTMLILAKMTDKPAISNFNSDPK